ncbi:hypothetical protein [Halovenus amylolytica]|uniref:hypothetical protein n=1 Tax=Halovenus amylolytica TaxID=2500550 RepID=UPI003D6BA1EB
MITETDKIELEKLVEVIKTEFDEIVEIYISYQPILSDVESLYIFIHTGSVGLVEQYVDITSAELVSIDVGTGDPLHLPFTVLATFEGPGHPQGGSGTTMYMSENIRGAEPRELDTGLSILREKFAGICPHCKSDVEELSEHFLENLECARQRPVVGPV